MQTDPDPLDAVLRDCLARRVNAAGTAYVLEDRSARLGRQLKFLAFLGLAVPVVVGGLVLGYGAGLKALGLVITIAAALTVLQLAVSVWATTAGWVDAQAGALRSAIRNRELARSFERVAREMASGAGAEAEYTRLVGKDDAQQDSDYALGFSPAETRAAHRAGLREYQAQCAGCGNIPKGMKATDCEVCGDFIRRAGWGFRAR